VPSLETGVDVDADGNVLVDITADVTDSFVAQLKEHGALIYGSYPAYRSVRALVPAARLESIATLPNVIFIAPKQEAITARYSSITPRNFASPRVMFAERSARVQHYLRSILRPVKNAGAGESPTGQGSETSEGDLTHRTFDARIAFGVNGAGIKIGVLSDGASNLAASQALGDLPSDVTVLPGQVGGGDEGTAMMEIVHDLAPGAKLYFATAFSGVASFAQNIKDLRAAGCDIIIDDVFYFDENPFVDGQNGAVASPSNGGLILQAVNDVTAAGALYFSSAGNEGNLDSGSAGAYESDFVDGGSLSLLAGGTIHLFDTSQYDRISANGGNYMMLFWSDPLGASANDYDLFVLNPAGTAVLEASTNVQDGTQDPVEFLSPTYNVTNNRLVVFKHTGAQNRYFHLNTFRGGLAVASAGETHGHSHAALAYSVAATPAVGAWSTLTPNGPYPNPFDASNQIEWFSSDGPRRLFYQADGTAFTPGDLSSSGGMVRQKPDITAADGVSVTGVGGFGSPFYGTSAAAPHAGAIAALVKSASPMITTGEMRTALTGSAVDIMGSGVDRDSGAGIVMAFEALSLLGVTGSANPELGTIVASDHPGNGNGMLEAGEGGIVTVQLKNTGGVVDAAVISATLTTTTPGVSITLPNVSAYANLPKLTGTGNNLSPFTFTLASDYPCGQTIDFVLTVTYTGGPNPRILRFTEPTGPLFNISTALDVTAPTSPMTGVTAATGTQIGRVSRNGVATTCATTPKAWPGIIGAATHQYDSYTFTATQDLCTTFTLASTNGISLFLDAYSPSFNPGDIPTDYFADTGSSSSTQSFSMTIVAGEIYTLTVHDVPSGAASGSNYNLQFSGCAFSSLIPNQPPVAQAHDVNAVADSNHTASESVDNGSYDPDQGDVITLTQTPPGPYPVGTTSVILTVIDSQGATSQANATVTVVDPNFDFGGRALLAKTVNAGESATQTITIRPNPAPWNSVVTLACSGLPALTTCMFNPTSVTPGDSNATTSLTVATTGPNAAFSRQRKSWLATWLGFSGLGLFAAASGIRRRRCAMRVFLAMLVFGLPALSLLSCGDRSTGASLGATPAGTYPITVTAISGGVSHQATFPLTVN
jgi:subtilase family protein